MKAAIILSDGFEDVEAITPIDVLRRADIDVDLISLQNKDEVVSSHNIKILAEYNYSDINLLEYDAIILPGGKAYLSYLEHIDLQKDLKKINEQRKLLAAICAAPSVLATTKVLEGKRGTSFPGVKNILEDNNVIVKDEKVIVYENVITAQSMACALDFSLAILEYLKGKESKDEMKKEVIY